MAAIWVFILVALDMCIDIYTASIIVMCCLVLCRVLGCCGVINDYNLKSNLNFCGFVTVPSLQFTFVAVYKPNECPLTSCRVNIAASFLHNSAGLFREAEM